MREPRNEVLANKGRTLNKPYYVTVTNYRVILNLHGWRNPSPSPPLAPAPKLAGKAVRRLQVLGMQAHRAFPAWNFTS